MLRSNTRRGTLVLSFTASMWSYDLELSGMTDSLLHTGGYHGNGCSSSGFNPCALFKSTFTLQNISIYNEYTNLSIIVINIQFSN